MNIVFCIMIFIMGTVFGSFFTLAVYRIPLELDITHERSFCPKCNHKLNFIDLIPILSYISVKGKCRYCGEKIRIRYLLLEVFSGLVFLACYLSYNMNFPFLEIQKLVAFIGFVFFYITVVIISGIDKENIKLSKSVLLFGILTQYLYMVYLYVSQNIDMYRYGMYLVIMLILFIIDTISLIKKGKSNYAVQVLMFIDYILMYIPFDISYLIAILSIFYIAVYALYKKFLAASENKPDILEKSINTRIGVEFCIGVSAILVVIVNNFYLFY